jgi:tRNA (guanosine-2'-O-)-methyltransferase
MQGFTESLNISVAASIMIYELNKRLRESTINYQLSEKEKYELMVKWTFNTVENAEGILKNYQF